MKYIINGQNKIIGKVGVPGSSLSASALISLSLLLNDTSKIENSPNSFGFNRLLDILISIFPKITKDQSESLLVDTSVFESPKQVNKFVSDEIKIEVDTDPEVFFVLPALLFKNTKIILEGSKVIFEKHKSILDLLKLFELFSEFNSRNVIVTRPVRIRDNYYFDFKNKGGVEAILAILIVLSLKTKITMINYPQDPVFNWFLTVITNCSITVDLNTRTNESNTVTVNAVDLPTGKLNGKVFFDDNLATFYSFVAMGTQGDLTISQINSQALMPFCAKILSWGAQVESLSSEEIKVYAQNTKIENSVSFEAKPYPGFVESWGYLALIYLISTQNTVSLIFPNALVIQTLIKELNRLGANLDFKIFGNYVKIESLKKSNMLSQKIILEERDLLLPYLLLGLLNKGKTILIGGELIDSYHPGLIENLNALGANINYG